jgi:hypothetical protein
LPCYYAVLLFIFVNPWDSIFVFSGDYSSYFRRSDFDFDFDFDFERQIEFLVLAFVISTSFLGHVTYSSLSDAVNFSGYIVSIDWMKMNNKL